MSLPNLGDHSQGATMTENQDDKYQTSNDLDALLDNAQNGVTNVPVSISIGDEFHIGTDDYLGAFLLNLFADVGSPTLDGNFRLIVGDQNKHFGVFNNTGFLCTVEAGGSPTGTSVAVPNGVVVFLHSDGESVRQAVNTTYDIAFTIAGALGFDELGGFFVANRAVVLSTGGSHKAYADTPSASGESDLVFDIVRNSTSHGSITFTSLDPIGVVSITTEINLSVGDRLKIITPPDLSEATDMADVTVTLDAAVTA